MKHDTASIEFYLARFRTVSALIIALYKKLNRSKNDELSLQLHFALCDAEDERDEIIEICPYVIEGY